jgi:hypothetical protein
VLSARVGSPGRSIYLFIGRRHGARSFFGWRALCPGRTQLGLPHGGLRGVGRTGGGRSDVGQTTSDGHLSARTTLSTNSGCLPRQTAGALIVTLLVTIRGTARALKHARAPSRPGKNGGAYVASQGTLVLLSPPILTAGRDGHGHLRGQSCPNNSGSSSEDVRCSDRDRGGHDSGISSCP